MKLALGLGCDRGTSLFALEAAIDEALMLCGRCLGDVAVVASIDLKADEPALLRLAEKRGWPIRFYAAAELAAVAVSHPSETVRRHTGTSSVAEAAALLAAGAACPLVEKHRHRGPDGRHVTVSLARIPE